MSVFFSKTIQTSPSRRVYSRHNGNIYSDNMNRGRPSYGRKRKRDDEEGGKKEDGDQMMVPAAASRAIGGIRSDDIDDGDEGKDQFGVKDVRAVLKLKDDHDSR